uniref:non-specific serine/threonine protein kinase n=1 Tax=Megaselia scalaris TaxID=36166 RepID=T1GZH7_MEGSC
MMKINLAPQAQVEMRKMLNQKESNYIRLKSAKMDKSMFVQIKAIGLGGIWGADVVKRNQVAHVKVERDILAEADYEWVVKLYYSFQDRDNVYFVMDYIPGGDLMSLLIEKEYYQQIGDHARQNSMEPWEDFGERSQQFWKDEE